MSSKTRLIFCTYSSVYSSIVLERLLSHPDIEVVAIVNSTRLFKPNYGHLRGAIKQIRTSGWRYATYLFLVTDGYRLVSHLPRLRNTPTKTVHQLAKENHIPVHETQDINNKSSLKFIKQHSADTLVAAHFNQLIKADILESDSLECLNIHPSLLPDYKGVDPVFYALCDQKSETGVTLHKMAEVFDTGETVSQTKVSLSLEDDLYNKNCQLFNEGAKLLIDYLMLAQNGQKGGGCSFSPSSEMKSNQGYDSWPTKKKVAQFKQLGMKLINLKSLWGTLWGSNNNA